jgi:fatty acid desaturase
MQYGRLLGATFLYLPLMPLVAWKLANRQERRDILLDYALMAVIYLWVFALVPVTELVPLWLAPIFLVGLFTNVRGFVQHGVTDRHDSLLASRSIHPHPLVAFLLLNENLHLEHHLFPEIPSYHLPQLSRLISPRLPRAVLADSYMEVLWNFFRATPRLDETPIGIRRNDLKETPPTA